MNITSIIVSGLVGVAIYLLISKDNWITRMKEAQKRGEKTPEMIAAEADAEKVFNILRKIKSIAIDVRNVVTKKLNQLKK